MSNAPQQQQNQPSNPAADKIDPTKTKVEPTGEKKAEGMKDEACSTADKSSKI